MNPSTGKTIVVVDDEIAFTDLLSQMLQDHFSCKVLAYSDPRNALRAMADLNVGMLVTDFYMPHIDGVELIRRTTARAQEVIPSIIITAHLLESDEGWVAPPGLKAVLAKPFRWRQLSSLIEQHWPIHEKVPLRATGGRA